MNPNQYAENKEFASGISRVPGMNLNVFGRVFETRRHLDRIQTSVEWLESFREQHENGNLTRDTASSGLAGVKRLMKSLDSIEYIFPELEEEVWFVGLQEHVHHAYWRVEEGRFDGVLDMEEDAIELFAGEVSDILSNITESTHVNPINHLHRFFEGYGREFDPSQAPEEYQKEVFEARDLYCLGYYSTGLIVLGRATERAILQLGTARRISSVDGFRGTTSWGDARFFERTEAMFNVDMPDDSGKMISKRQYHLIQILIDYRNKVAHKDYREISKDSARRIMGEALKVLTELEERREEVENMEDELINELNAVSINL
jgi:uncharacterized protein YutE (UPF0331/DUF86 family)